MKLSGVCDGKKKKTFGMALKPSVTVFLYSDQFCRKASKI